MVGRSADDVEIAVVNQEVVYRALLGLPGWSEKVRSFREDIIPGSFLGVSAVHEQGGALLFSFEGDYWFAQLVKDGASTEVHGFELATQEDILQVIKRMENFWSWEDEV